jgi:hypothetical protein
MSRGRTSSRRFEPMRGSKWCRMRLSSLSTERTPRSRRLPSRPRPTSCGAGSSLGQRAGLDADRDPANVGIAVVWYPRRAWDGLLLEAGVLRRARDVYVWPEFEEKTFTRSTEYAGRALIGWSWLIREHLFIAIAARLSRRVCPGGPTWRPARTSRSPLSRSH